MLEYLRDAVKCWRQLLQAGDNGVALSIIFLHQHINVEAEASYEAICSITAKLKAIEVIVVSQASNESVFFSNSDSFIKYSFVHHVLSQSGRNYSDEINCAVNSAKGKILLFFGDQCLINSRCLYAHVSRHDLEKVCVLGQQIPCAVSSLFPIGDSVPSGARFRKLLKPIYCDPFLLSLDMVHSSFNRQPIDVNDGVFNMSIPRHLFLDVGGFDPHLEHLWGFDFQMRLHKNKIPVYHVPAANAMHQVTNVSSRSTELGLRREMATISCRYQG